MFTDTEHYSFSECFVYRVLKANDLITSPAFMWWRLPMSSKTRPPRSINCGRPTLPTWRLLDRDGSISAWSWTITAVTSSCGSYAPTWRLKMWLIRWDWLYRIRAAIRSMSFTNHVWLSDNGSSYVSGDLAEWLQDKGMKHSRGAPYHPQTQGKIERWHQILKNRILLENYFLPSDFEAHIEAFVDHYNY